MNLHRTMTVAAFLLLSACASRVEQEYGQAVRQMINAQTFDPATLASPSTEPVIGAHPDMLNAAIEVFRNNVSRPEEGGRDVILQLGSRGGQGGQGGQ